MYANEKRGDNPAEFPMRFLPFMQREKIFDYADPEHGVDVVASISAEQLEALAAVFPEFPRERAVLSANGYNQQVFRVLPDVYDNRADVLAGLHPATGGATARPSPWHRRTGSTRWWRSAASSPTGSASTPCSAPPRSTSSRTRRS